MKTFFPRFYPLFFIGFILLNFVCSSLLAQQFSSPAEYMNFIGIQHREITKDMLSYTSAANHGKSARKVENRRKELLKTTQDAIRRVRTMAPYKGDKSLRDSTAAYLTKINHVLNNDYGKIVNMEEIAEQSYDAMEAYLTAQDLAGERIDIANKNLVAIEKQFADKYEVKLIDTKDELEIKTEKTSKVNAYHRIFYLAFFKSYKQEAYFYDALKKKDINGAEQNKAALEKTSIEGLSKISTVAPFNGDGSLKNACKQLLEFYKSESTGKLSLLSSFALKEENFNKIKTAFDLKKPNERTKEDIDLFNKSVSEYNNAVKELNNVNNTLDATRNKLIDNWNKVSSDFLDKHTPKYR